MKTFLLTALALTATSGLYAQKLSPNAEALLMTRHSRPAGMRMLSVSDSTSVETVKVFIDMYDDAAINEIEKLGANVYMNFDGCVTAEVPVDRLREISEIDDVKFVQMGTPVNLLLDKVRPSIGMDKVHSYARPDGATGYTGKGVVVGVIDTGLEYGHIAFRGKDGTSWRLKRVWNQNGVGRTPSLFKYGSELTTQGEMEASRYDTASEYHGTHTTGIATGADISSGYYGMAPDAEIVFVSFGSNDVDIPNAVKYIFDYAESVGKPCVINMSLGVHMGPHDGTSATDRYFSEAVGPGKILVGACGNEGESALHISKNFTADDTSLRTLLSYNKNNKNSAIDIWGSEGSDFTLQIAVVEGQKGKILESSPIISATEGSQLYYSPNDENTECYFYINPVKNPVNGRPNIYVEAYVTSLSDTRYIGLIVTGKDGSSVHMYNASNNDFVNAGLRGWEAGANAGTVGEIGGTSPDVVSVGSYNTRFNFPLYNGEAGVLYGIEGMGPNELPLNDISSFSSRGPTADGRMKPDVLAPGAFVVSSVNKYDATLSQNLYYTVAYTQSGNTKYYYDIQLGTSMSTPAVTGAIATWLEANPDLTTEQILDIIHSTANSDRYTGTVPNYNAGYGKFDAYKGLLKVIETVGTEKIGIDNAEDTRVWVEAGTKNLCCVVAAQSSVEIYNVAGAHILNRNLDAALNTIDMSAFPGGVYILRFANGKSVKIAI